ncbi:MAG: choline dehydrogenase [Alphaproteobacteria bacterium]|nr:MAG: choline dehydrogenase [Alphaproteobacteria bacterium]
MEADYVIVGAGSAGCALAYRLSEDGTRSVLVIEAGGSDAGPLIQMPGALSYPMNMPLYDWGYRTEPEPGLGGRRLVAPRGKVIGGSSSINGMVYVRGHARDFDHWAEAGAEGWAFADVLPYFRRMECWHGAADGADPSWRGLDGPLHVTRGPRDNPLHKAFVTAGRQAGYGVTPDYNGWRQEGFGPMEMTVWQGRRWSAANAYLKPALRRPNCDLLRGLATRVVIEEGRAVGVELRRGGPRGRPMLVRARREVILAASAFNSPKLLMLSGIGPAAHLAAHGIEVIADRPGVGANLQDHLEVYVQFAARQPVTLFRYWNLLGKAWVGLRWLLTRSGPGASNNFESAAFIRSAPGVEYPDIQFHFLPIAVRYDGRAAAEGHGFQAHVGPMRSPSRGRVRLTSADPAAAPSILFNYMSEPQDWIDFRRCIRLTREIFAQPAMAAHVRHEIQPGPAVQSDDEIDDFIRHHAESAFHPCGTCRMGRRDDPLAVVDPDCRVIGVERLRVVDSSIFPRITNGNLNAPSIMVGEKAADHILGRRLPRDEREPWIDPLWRERQREGAPMIALEAIAEAVAAPGDAA